MANLLDRNTLFYGDNLPILREYIPSESIDLIYLDPPFNSNRSYNVLFKNESGSSSEAQITAFDDTWHWGPSAEETYHELVTQASPEISRMISALREFIGANQMMAYLVMMAARLVELHRVLKPTGSLYLHCDPTASHYLKIILDVVFGNQNFRNEIVWCYKRWPSKQDNFQQMHDIIFRYSKTKDVIWNQLYDDFTEQTKKRIKGGMKIEHIVGESGKILIRPTDEKSPGVAMCDYWNIPMIAGQAKERLGYPTQKPVALLDRIIQASSNLGDLVLDPFCGCGTTIAAAQKLSRRWIGIDITHLSISLQKYRLKDAYNLEAGKDYQVIGEPVSLESARQLAQEDRYQFQWWALSLVKARPLGGESDSKQGKKGSDKGIDGIITYIDDPKGKPSTVVVQVKSGKVNSKDIRDLIGVLDREKSVIGVFITLEKPTRDMLTESVSAGYYESQLWQKKYPRLQILTIEDLLEGKQIDMPPAHGTFKQAVKEDKPGPYQGKLNI